MPQNKKSAGKEETVMADSKSKGQEWRSSLKVKNHDSKAAVNNWKAKQSSNANSASGGEQRERTRGVERER